MLTNSITGDLKHQFRYGNVITKLILVNIGVFIAFGLMHAIAYLAQATTWYQTAIRLFQVPASLHTLLYRPWSLFTYMFLHEGFFHILFNMLWFYWFGQIFVLFLGEKKILPLYVIGGLTGAVFYLAAFNSIPLFKQTVQVSYMMGASASVFAIVFASATLQPDYEVRLLFFGDVKIKYLAIIPLLLDIISIPQGNAGGYIAHLGGAFSGYAYIKLLQSGTDIGRPFNRFFDAVASVFKPKPPMRVVYRSNAAKPTPHPKARVEDEQAKIDAILDKISRSGYDSLSQQEKDFLFYYSNK